LRLHSRDAGRDTLAEERLLRLLCARREDEPVIVADAPFLSHMRKLIQERNFIVLSDVVEASNLQSIRDRLSRQAEDSTVTFMYLQFSGRLSVSETASVVMLAHSMGALRLLIEKSETVQAALATIAVAVSL
jgi:hypothetical protein